ncbi:MAG: peptide ABC transporter substrate-binding protein [Akkermansiaceae bacterium]|nr:peptide ABC transporter substrate-binding protein [Akkermansiaceae bacterium]
MSLFLVLAGALLVSCDGRTAADRAAEAGILIMGNSSEPKGLDSQLVTGVLESNIIRSLFEGLCTEHPSKDGVALPGAAERWEANDNFSVWTFHLRPEGVWSDGVPVTAGDFLFSYERILTASLGSDYAEMLFYIKGAEEFYKRETDDFSTVGVKALDDYTLEITLRGSLPFLPEITKHYTWYPVPRHVVLEYSDGKIDVPFSGWTQPGNLVCNGPFLLKSWRINDHIEVVKNPRYWDAETVQLNGIRFVPVINSYTEARMFFDGLLHITYTLPPELIPFANEHHPEETRGELYLGTRFVRFNVTRPPLDNPKVRRALALTIDRNSLIDNVLQGGQMPAYGMVPPFGDYETEHAVDFDPAEARRLLAEAGFADPSEFPRIKLLTADRDVSKRMAEAYQGMWKEHLGISIDIEQKEWTSYQNAMTKLEYDLVDGGWIGDYLDPTTFLDMWIGGGGNNRTGWASKEFEAALRQSEHVRDPAARLEVLQKAERILMSELPALPIYWYTTNYLIDRRVEGWSPLLLNNHPYKWVSFQSAAE